MKFVGEVFRRLIKTYMFAVFDDAWTGSYNVLTHAMPTSNLKDTSWSTIFIPVLSHTVYRFFLPSSFPIANLPDV